MRATPAIAPRCTKPRVAAMAKSSGRCSVPARTCMHATSTAARPLDAARGGHLEVLERLLPHRPEVAHVDHDGRDALMLAGTAERADPQLVRRLLDPRPRSDAPRQRPAPRRRSRRRRRDAGRSLRFSTPRSAAGGRDGCGRDDAGRSRAGHAVARWPARRSFRRSAHGGRPVVAPRARCAAARVAGRGPGHGRAARRCPHRLAARAWCGPGCARRRGRQRDVRAARPGPVAAAALQALLRRAVSPAGAGGFARFLGACVASDHAGRALELLAIDLLDRGADPYAPLPAGDPPLALAVRLGWLRVVERLVSYGVDLNARDSHGMTALHLAAALGRESALKALIAQGADPEMRAADGQTPLGVALSSGRRDLADWPHWRGWPLPGRPLQAADLPSAAIVGEVHRASPYRSRPRSERDRRDKAAPHCCARPAADIAPWQTRSDDGRIKPITPLLAGHVGFFKRG